MDIEAILKEYHGSLGEYREVVEQIKRNKVDITESETRKEKKVFENLANALESKKNECASRYHKIVRDYLSQLIKVPGDEERFEQLAGFAVEVVPTETPDKGVLIVDKRGGRVDAFGFEQHNDYRTSPDWLLEHRVVGIINAQLTQSDWSSRWDHGTERIHYGLPVTKKEA